jgi:molybdopterin-guanine dinucleotide biosynthesis protein A
MPRFRFDAVVLTGGRGDRLGGADKACVVVAGATLLDRARAAVAAADRVVVVGPEVAGGPVPAVAAGLREVGSDAVVLLACDMPLVGPATVDRLLQGLGSRGTAGHAALLVDPDGRWQYLAGAYRTRPLRRALADLGDPAGASMRRVVEALRVVTVAAQAEEAMDCDTWAQVHRAERLLEER